MHDTDAPFDGFDLVFQLVDVDRQVSSYLLARRLVDNVTKLDLEQLDV